MKIKITADSTCDLPQALVEQHDIAILPMAVAMGERDYQDGVDITPQDLYDHVAAGGELPQTAAMNIAGYVSVFARYAGDYDAVVHVSVGATLSSCYQNAKVAAGEFDNVYVADSNNLCNGHGLLVLMAAELAESGMEPLRIVEAVEAAQEKVNASFILNQLDYLKKGGRCSAVAVLGANFLKLKPCIEVKNGVLSVGKKYRGAYEKCLKEYITDRLQGQTEIQRIFVVHSGVCAEWEQLAVETVRSLQPQAELLQAQAGCTISSHCGPDTMSIMFIRN